MKKIMYLNIIIILICMLISGCAKKGEIKSSNLMLSSESTEIIESILESNSTSVASNDQANQSILIGTFQNIEWGDYAHLQMVGNDGISYSFFIESTGGVKLDSLIEGQKIKVIWQNIDKLLDPPGEVINIDEILSIELLETILEPTEATTPDINNNSYIGKKVLTKSGLGITVTRIDRSDGLGRSTKPTKGYEFIDVTFTLSCGENAESNINPHMLRLFVGESAESIGFKYLPKNHPLGYYHTLKPYEEIQNIILTYEILIGEENMMFCYIDTSNKPLVVIPLMDVYVQDVNFSSLDGNHVNVIRFSEGPFTFISLGYETFDLNSLLSGDKIRITSVSQIVYNRKIKRDVDALVIIDIKLLK